MAYFVNNWSNKASKATFLKISIYRSINSFANRLYNEMTKCLELFTCHVDKKNTM